MARTYSKSIKQRARHLRHRGWSLGEINVKMKIPKNTISGWVKDIELTQKQKERIKEKITASGAIGRPLAAKLLSKKMEQWKEGIRQKTKHYPGLLQTNPEIKKLICGLLYLCEGAKYPSTRYLHFGNSDPRLIMFFIALLRTCYNIDENKLRFSISYRCDQDFRKLKRYWSKVTGIPAMRCLSSKPDMRTKGKPTLRKDYRGICRVLYYDTSLQFELQSIGEVIINGPYWIKLELVSGRT